MNRAPSNPPVRPLAQTILAAAARIQSHLERVCTEFGITLAQFNVLCILKDGPADGYPRREILSRMLQPSADCTRLIDRLEKMGLVARKRTESDRRLSLTTITPKGNELFQRMEQTFLMAEQELVQGIPESEQQKVMELLQSFLVSGGGKASRDS